MAKQKHEIAEKTGSRFSGRGCLWLILLCAGLTFFTQNGTRDRSANVTAIPQSTRARQVQPTATRTTRITETQPTLTNTIIASQEERKDARISFKVNDVQVFEEFNGNKPGNDLLLVLQGDFQAKKDTCIYTRNIRLIIDNAEYPPDQSWMYEVRYITSGAS